MRATNRFKNGQAKPRTPSRFLSDIPDKHLEPIDLSPPRGARKEAEMKKGRDFFARMDSMFADAPDDKPV